MGQGKVKVKGRDEGRGHAHVLRDFNGNSLTLSKLASTLTQVGAEIETPWNFAM